jgi:hypothetical protein
MPAACRTRAQPAPALDTTPAATPVPKGKKKKKPSKKNTTPSQIDAEHNTNDLLMQIVSRMDGMDTNIAGMHTNMAGINFRLAKVETKPAKKHTSPKRTPSASRELSFESPTPKQTAKVSATMARSANSHVKVKTT